MQKQKAFTLIEMLVVIMIVGGLAAFAVMEYYKTVEETIGSKMIQTARMLNESQQRFFLENNRYATSFDELDISFPGAKREIPSYYTQENSHFINDENCMQNGAQPGAWDGAIDMGDFELAIGHHYNTNIFSMAARKGKCGIILFSLPDNSQNRVWGPLCYSQEKAGTKESDSWCKKVFPDGTRIANPWTLSAAIYSVPV